jgi:hypothetical protein
MINIEKGRYRKKRIDKYRRERGDTGRKGTDTETGETQKERR